MPWKVIEPETMDELLQIIRSKTYTNLIYRGQSNCENYELKSSLARNSKLASNEIEKQMIDEFNSKAHLYPEGKDYDCKDQLETLAMMQHYGAPTRLMDWSYSPFIALYFAVKNSFNDKDGVLYCLNWDYISLFNNLKYKKLAKNYNEIVKKDKIDINIKCDAITFGEKYKEIIKINNSIEEDNFLQKYEPKKKNIRLDKQQGLFLISSKINIDYNNLLKNYNVKNGMYDNTAALIQSCVYKNDKFLFGLKEGLIKINKTINNIPIDIVTKIIENRPKISTNSVQPFKGKQVATKIIISKDIKEEVLQYLQLMNISNETLFPEIEGFCMGLKHKMIKKIK